MRHCFYLLPFEAGNLSHCHSSAQWGTFSSSADFPQFPWALLVFPA